MKANAKPEHWTPFVTEWQNYLAMMSGEGDHVQSSGDLTEEVRAPHCCKAAPIDMHASA